MSGRNVAPSGIAANWTCKPGRLRLTVFPYGRRAGNGCRCAPLGRAPRVRMRSLQARAQHPPASRVSNLAGIAGAPGELPTPASKANQMLDGMVHR
jgi:hypothetical protein